MIIQSKLSTTLDVEFKSHKNREVNEISQAFLLGGQRFHCNTLSFFFDISIPLGSEIVEENTN